jgi:hypothetical protein
VDWHRLSARRPAIPFFDGGDGSRGTFNLRICVNWNENFYHMGAWGANDNRLETGFLGTEYFGCIELLLLA